MEFTEAYGFEFAYPRGDLAVGRCLRDHGEFARVGATLSAQISRGGSFVDVGANIGAITLPVARSAAHVVAIEAHPGIASLLSRNVTKNRLDNVQVLNAAAGAIQGFADFPALPLDGTGNFGMSAFGRQGVLARVPVVTLNDVAPSNTAMVKIDVEGYEAEVLAGASRVLSEVRPHWIVEADTDTQSSRATLKIMREAEYILYWFYDPFVTPLAPKAPWAGKRRGDLNVFGVPAEAPQPTGMLEIKEGDPWPTNISGFHYLKAFGIAVS